MVAYRELSEAEIAEGVNKAMKETKPGDANELLAKFQAMAKESGYVLVEARLSCQKAARSGAEVEVSFRTDYVHR